MPWLVAAVGLVLLVFGITGDERGAARAFAIASGAIGPLIALAYLRQPAWKHVVLVDEQGVTVRRGDVLRFQLAWADVVEVVHSTRFPTLFLDGGVPEKSLLVPGPGAPAAYRIERAPELIAFVLAHVPAAKQRVADPEGPA